MKKFFLYILTWLVIASSAIAVSSLLPCNAWATPISQRGMEFIAGFEGKHLKAYPDPGTGGKPWTIGIGHTRGVYRGMVITELQMYVFFREDLHRFEYYVEKVCGILPEHQNAARISLFFNIGSAGRNLLKAMKERDDATMYLYWRRYTRAGGRELRGLVRRRVAEINLDKGLLWT